MTNPKQNQKRNSKDFICLCNSVPKDVIENAIERGCDTLPKIFDATTAGVGPCGGSCRTTLDYILKTYLQTGKFPASPRHPKTKQRLKK